MTYRAVARDGAGNTAEATDTVTVALDAGEPDDSVGAARTLVLGTASGNSEEGATLYVHAMFADSRDDVVASLRDMEDRLLRASRGKEGARLAREAEYEYQRRHANDPKEQA